MTSYVVVIPTLGRPCLQACLDALAAADAPLPRQVVLADDRRDTPDPLPVTVPAPLAGRTVVVTLEGRGPAAARNAGRRGGAPRGAPERGRGGRRTGRRGGVPRRRRPGRAPVAGRAGGRPGWVAGRRGRHPGRDRRAAAAGPPADRLGARHG